MMLKSIFTAIHILMIQEMKNFLPWNAYKIGVMLHVHLM